MQHIRALTMTKSMLEFDSSRIQRKKVEHEG